MAVNEEKLSKFNQAINHYAQEQRLKIEQEVAEFKQHELEEAEVEVLAEAYQLIQNEMAEMRGSITREMAHREMDARRDLLAKRQKITDEVFQRASDKLTEFTKTEAYAKVLEKYVGRLPAAFHQPGTILMVKPADEKYRELVQRAFGDECTFQTDEEILIGGLRAYHPAAGMMADETLDSMLEEQREWFEETSGLTVV